MFNFQQSLGMLFMAISIFFIYSYFNVKRIKYIIISSIFLLSAASIYQAFVVVYLVMIIAYILICSLNSNFFKIKETITNVMQAMIPFIIGVLIYFILNKIITTYIAPDPNNYLNGYVGWNKGRNPIHVILTTFHYIEKILFGDSIVYGGKVLLIITCLFLIFSVTLLIKIKKHTSKFIAFITSILLLISPFTMAIILGTSGVNGRTYVALPLAGAIELLLIINKTVNVKFVNPIVILATVFVLLFNSMYMNRLFYNSFMVYKHDSTMGSEIIHDISMYGYNYSQKPIVFIGMHDVDRKIFSYNSGSTGGSFFSWDDGNNTRIVNFLRSEGYDIIMPSTDEIKLAYNSSKNLSNWPRAHSIKQLNNFIIVKLSTPTKTWMSVNDVK
ncbi:MAG: glucosyltransferase domain-containing protein [Clostridium sp.]|nr:glucosyltransferase domain-containing protein [Clostridium sp.]